MAANRLRTKYAASCGVLFLLAALSPTCCWAASLAKPSTGKGASPTWQVIETRNFRIHSFGSRQLDPQVAARCEAFRSQILSSWFPTDEDRPWTPKCILVLHGSRACYRSAVGRLADCTVASCTIQVLDEKTTKRRIDVCASCPGWLDCLPHELTHALLQGRFATGDLPRWADEGMALVADSASKRAAHQRDLHEALHGGRQLRLVELLQLVDYPQDERLGIFYGQSLSVVEFLLDRGGRQKFVEFIQRLNRSGYDSALQSTYGLPDVAHLETLWLAHARAGTAFRAAARTGASEARPDDSRQISINTAAAPGDTARQEIAIGLANRATNPKSRQHAASCSFAARCPSPLVAAPAAHVQTAFRDLGILSLAHSETVQIATPSLPSAISVCPVRRSPLSKILQVWHLQFDRTLASDVQIENRNLPAASIACRGNTLR